MKRITFAILLLCASSMFAEAQNADFLNLLPRPQSVKINDGRFLFTTQFTIGIKGPASEKLTQAVNRFYLQLSKRTGIYFPQEFITAADNKVDAQFLVRFDQTVSAQIGTDEGYSLTVSADKMVLSAKTDIGALRGLETLYQLVTPTRAGFYCPNVEITDSPRFKWRGLMIDVARHFIPFEVLKRNIDAMAIVKMNVLHLHLSDDEGFRVESKALPKLQQLGSDGFYYTQEQIKQLVNYAHDRGIIIVPEFDLPGHCTSILAAYPFLASYPSNYKPAKRYNLDTIKNINLGTVMKLINNTPTPTIDPTQENTYAFFDTFFKEMSGLFPDAYLHIGADENNGVAWKQNPAIMAFMTAKNIKSTDDLQAYFVERLRAIAKKYDKRVIGWEEAFNPSVSTDVIIQKWKASNVDTLSNKIISHNNQMIVSAGYYLDLYYPSYIHYLNDPVSSNVSQVDADKGILGAEAAMWSELVNGDNEEIRVWPRTAAIAERMWSAANVKDVDDMYRRLWAVDFELNDRAIDENANYLKMISRWTNGTDISPVTTLTNLCVQVKGYRRLMGVMLGNNGVRPNLSSPMVNIADVVHCESESRWYFRKLVASYLDKHDPTALEQIKSQLQKWQDNKVQFDALAAGNPYLQQIQDLSNNLSKAAGITLVMLSNKGEEGALGTLQTMENPLHEVQLSILPELEALVTGKLNPEPAVYPMF